MQRWNESWAVVCGIMGGISKGGGEGSLFEKIMGHFGKPAKI